MDLIRKLNLIRSPAWTLLALMLGVASTAVPGDNAAAIQDFRSRLPQDEVVYFLLPDRFENGDTNNDRGGLTGGKLITGFDPTDKAFYHGGDLKGLLSRLDYIQSLGATAIWIGPVYKNKPVQGAPGHESAGYHGYWITDFTHVDPHFGTNADLRAVIAAAHARGIKIYLDIITNHTADVIAYRECSIGACPYRSEADYPYTRRGGLQGEPINQGFMGDSAQYQTDENFAKLTRPDYAYTPYVPSGQEHIKVPDWLNDPIYYHNRGNSTFHGESSLMGDFNGLDDVFTENPRVVRGFIEIYGNWIDQYGVDGFRIDTEKHVNAEFWQQFAPAMRARAAADGIPNFHMFGEAATDAMDSALLARHTRVDRMPAMLDFAFASAVRQTVAGWRGTEALTELFANDALYEGGAATALQLPTFISNHDHGRFAFDVRKVRPEATDEEVLQRVSLAYAMLFTLRGVPVIYYGDEQGFPGTGGDQDAREDMFASQVPSYNAEHLLGTAATTARSSFNTHHPLFRSIAELAHIRQHSPAIRRGMQIVRNDSERPGLFAVSRFDPQTGAETVIAFNTSSEGIEAQTVIDPATQHFTALHGHCEPAPSAPGSYHIHLDALDYVVCEGGARH